MGWRVVLRADAAVLQRDYASEGRVCGGGVEGVGGAEAGEKEGGIHAERHEKQSNRDRWSSFFVSLFVFFFSVLLSRCCTG